MLTGILFVCPAGISEQYEVEEKWRKVKKTSRGVSASHVSLISVKLSALERSPSGAMMETHKPPHMATQAHTLNQI